MKKGRNGRIRPKLICRSRPLLPDPLKAANIFMERPDLENLDPEILAYIQFLEGQIEALQDATAESASRSGPSPLEPQEPPTTQNVITISRSGLAKRTPRHFYGRQRRGGMGIFDLESPEDDPPAFLVLADVEQHLLLITNLGRMFRLPVNRIHETPVRGRGQPLFDQLPFSLKEGEEVTAITADEGGKYLVLFSERGWVRRVRSNLVGPRMIAGTTFHDVKNGGPLVAAAWADDEEYIFLVTHQGQAIRFAANQVPVSGCRGMRVPPEDAIFGGAAVNEESGVFMLGPDGKGTIRLMAGFRANKAPGAGGKVAMKADRLVACFAADESNDIFIISQLGKIIRFSAEEIPTKEGVVQGVNCMSLRADETITAVKG
ncbi:MAG: DNA gyrase C-terminal beta-propeller domain-containing protein [Candidatus Promineifilaceae bacterium]